MLTTVEVITFKGCESATLLRQRIERLIAARGLDVEVELRLVHSPRQAEVRGLFGAPTLLRDGVEYQDDRRGPAGFYCRIFSTLEGFRAYPLDPEILTWLEGERVPRGVDPEGDLGECPVLLTADWCAISSTAVNFWKEQARGLDGSLRVVDVGADEGQRIVARAKVAGVPCVVARSGRLAYGLEHSPADARTFLRAG